MASVLVLATAATAPAFAGGARPGESEALAPGNIPDVAATERNAERATIAPGEARLPGGESLAPGAPDRQTPALSGRRIVVSITRRKLALIDHGRVLKVYPVAVGAPESPSPTGQFRIVSRLTSPTWYHPGKVVGPGKANPLGTRWVGLSRKGYGIHGTSMPDSIGHAASHGCIRMRTPDAEDLFKRVRVGDTVEITLDRPTGELTEEQGLSAARPGHSRQIVKNVDLALQ